HHAKIEIRTQKAENAVRFKDCVLRLRQFLPQPRHGSGQVADARTHPEGACSPRREIPGRVCAAFAVAFFADRDRVLIRLAVTWLSVGRAEAVAKLRDLEC